MNGSGTRKGHAGETGEGRRCWTKSIDLHGSFILADLRDEDLNPNKSLVTIQSFEAFVFKARLLALARGARRLHCFHSVQKKNCCC